MSIQQRTQQHVSHHTFGNAALCRDARETLSAKENGITDLMLGTSSRDLFGILNKKVGLLAFGRYPTLIDAEISRHALVMFRAREQFKQRESQTNKDWIEVVREASGNFVVVNLLTGQELPPLPIVVEGSDIPIRGN